jgi:tetratricopeptide (TPR) repeat protein
MTELVPGRILASRFELRRLLGRGGMGQVWLAVDGELQEQIAVKSLDPALAADADMLELLRQECRQARRLAHRNIVRVYDVHYADGHAFISMEFVEGGELGQFRDGNPADIVAKILPLTSALGYAHAQGIVHRDVKPSNVLIDREGMPRLLDFGIAGILHGDRTLRVAGGGSPLSMSPQQRAGLPPSPADDAFALGVMIYELIAGFPPSVEVGGPPPQPVRSRMNYAVPRRLQALVSRLLAAEAVARPSDMAGIGAELEAVLSDLRNRTRPPEIEVVPAAPDREEIVPAVRRTTPAVAPTPKARRSPGGRLPVVIWSAFGLLAVLLIGVIFFLPDFVERQRPSAVTESALQAPTGDQELERLATLKAQADQMAARFEPLDEGLRSRGVEDWGGVNYKEIQGIAHAAAEARDAGRYETAGDGWRRAIAGLESLEEKGRELLQASLDRGAEALGEGRRAAAEEAFGMALVLDPDNAAATAGMARASNIERVFALYSEAGQLEQQGDLTGALDRYREVADLDPEFPGPSEAVPRVQAAIVNRRYTSAMSAAYAALTEGRYEEAIGAFETASRIRPSAEEPAEGITRAREEQRVANIADGRARAEAMEAGERWQDALEVYRVILADDPTVVFAQSGSRRAAARAALDARLQGFIDDPERMYSPQVQAAAGAAIAEARSIEQPGPRLQAQVSRVETLVAEAIRPVRVTLQSDNLTDVMLYQVGRLGTFDRFQLELRPGTYTAVGTRKGFRDVRQQFTVRPGEPAGPYTIRCEEPI